MSVTSTNIESISLDDIYKTAALEMAKVEGAYPITNCSLTKKEIIMGFFSWKTADTEESIPSIHSSRTPSQKTI